MWNECKLWIIDFLISITLFLCVPIILFATGLIYISVAPEATLIIAGYTLYIFQCVFSQDMRRGFWALVDLGRRKTVTHSLVIKEIQLCQSRFSVSRRSYEQTFAKYSIIRCINTSEKHVHLVTIKQLDIIENESYQIKYYPFSKIIVDISKKA